MFRGSSWPRPRRSLWAQEQGNPRTLTQEDNLKGLALMNPQWVELAMPGYQRCCYRHSERGDGGEGGGNCPNGC